MVILWCWFHFCVYNKQICSHNPHFRWFSHEHNDVLAYRHLTLHLIACICHLSMCIHLKRPLRAWMVWSPPTSFISWWVAADATIISSTIRCCCCLLPSCMNVWFIVQTSFGREGLRARCMYTFLLLQPTTTCRIWKQYFDEQPGCSPSRLKCQ